MAMKTIKQYGDGDGILVMKMTFSYYEKHSILFLQ